ncbi:MAG: ribosome silencing factor [Acutalibacteraceae bacterium]
MQAKQLLTGVVTSLDKHKAEDIRVIGVTDLTSIADYFVIAAGSSSTQVKALVDYVEDEMARQGVQPLRIEGYASANWTLLDYGSVVVHVFRQDTRSFYDLERLWQDGQLLDAGDFIANEE